MKKLEKLEMQAYVEERAEVLVQDLQSIAQDISDKENLDFDACSNVIWASGVDRDLIHAAHSAGELAALQHLVRTFGVEVSAETKERFKWQSVLDPD